jgi:hypothetical protein
MQLTKTESKPDGSIAILALRAFGGHNNLSRTTLRRADAYPLCHSAQTHTHAAHIHKRAWRLSKIASAWLADLMEVIEDHRAQPVSNHIFVLTAACGFSRRMATIPSSIQMHEY